MKPLLLALLLAAGACRHTASSSSTEHTETSTTTESTSSETGNTTTVTTTNEGPSKTVTVTEEYAAPEPQAVAPSQDGGEPSDGGVNTEAKPNSPIPRPSHGPLTRRTVTTTTKGAETTETHQQAVTQGTAATEMKAAGESDVQAKAADSGGPSAGCIGSSWLIGLGIALFAAALILGVIKMRKAV